MHCISIELPVIISIGKLKKFKIIKFSIMPGASSCKMVCKSNVSNYFINRFLKLSQTLKITDSRFALL